MFTDEESSFLYPQPNNTKTYQYSFEVFMQGSVEVKAVRPFSKTKTKVNIFTALGHFDYKVSISEGKINLIEK